MIFPRWNPLVTTVFFTVCLWMVTTSLYDNCSDKAQLLPFSGRGGGKFPVLPTPAGAHISIQ